MKVLEKNSVSQAYGWIRKMLALPAIQSLMFVLLTSVIPFGACNYVSNLRLLEKGVKKETIALFEMMALPFSFSLSIFIMGSIRNQRYLLTWFTGWKVRFECILSHAQQRSTAPRLLIAIVPA